MEEAVRDGGGRQQGAVALGQGLQGVAGSGGAGAHRAVWPNSGGSRITGVADDSGAVRSTTSIGPPRNLGDPALEDVPSFTMGSGAYDSFQYTLRFGGRTVMTDRSGEEPALDRLIDALDDWLPRT